MSDDINSSELGTLEYWENRYSLEIRNFKDHEDVGEVWFGEGTSTRIVKWITSNIPLSSRIIDIGCGNGMLLVGLAEVGFRNIHGVDYSPKAIELAKAVSERWNITYTVGSVLESGIFTELFDVVLDKGTYDAISLDPVDGKAKRLKYVSNVHDLLTLNGILLITSCNWTQDELLVQFADRFDLVELLPAPTFQFGGSSGNTVATVVLRKR